MTQEHVSSFEKTQAQLQGFHTEIGILTKKSQNDALNNFKLKFVNQTLAAANKLLGKEYMPFEDFEQFEEVDMPTNSDVTMILGQYLECMEKLRSDNIKEDNFGDWYWRLDKNGTGNATLPPKRIKQK